MKTHAKKYPAGTFFTYELQLDGTYTIYEKHRDNPWRKVPVILGVRGSNVNRKVTALEEAVSPPENEALSELEAHATLLVNALTCLYENDPAFDRFEPGALRFAAHRLQAFVRSNKGKADC